MQRRISTAVAIALCSASSPASAHGIEGFVQFLAITGAVVGLVGGAAAAALPYRAFRSVAIGLLASEGLLFGGGMAYAVLDMGTSADPIGDLGAMALWLAVFAALPLAISFFIAFAGASLFRLHVWPGRKEREPAP